MAYPAWTSAEAPGRPQAGFGVGYEGEVPAPSHSEPLRSSVVRGETAYVSGMAAEQMVDSTDDVSPVREACQDLVKATVDSAPFEPKDACEQQSPWIGLLAGYRL